MSGDSKIGPVGGIGRTGPLRKVAGETVAAMRAPAQLQPAQDNLPTARLSRLATSLADQAPPVDVARVASLRTAIGNGSYGVHPAIIASAMLDFHSRGGE
ncbi:MAG: flagellar biosynthesis anti-sigma factor FlgM [Sphingopyxis sp.]|uniref:flagellar biosynthesis anti-sigma factor FlgM n=1 Tax=Sphingopyxis sp. TaxID=1908224 RepID=UPI001A340221|nr:flagellar biosynthesis anti-sigma factor FlgM [Sphingopyxis sp.]MBJ7501072.1 flagellar biosynthesis anti-sigma factor FlgM [Sphingopyxis sp.]